MSEIAVGCHVKIKGLSSKPRYNGFTGKVFVAQNEEGRWGVEFFFTDGVNDLKTILAKETNLEVLSQTSPPLLSSGKILLVDGFGNFVPSFVTSALLEYEPAFFKEWRRTCFL